MIVSNFVNNSTERRFQIEPWRLIPQPVLLNKTNTSIALMVVLEDVMMYATNVTVQVNKYLILRFSCIISFPDLFL